MPAANYINDGDQTDFPDARYVHACLRIEIPLVMGSTFHLDHWDGQFALFLIATGQLLGTQECCHAGATGQGLIFPAEINPQFGQQSRRPSAGMRAAHLHNGLVHPRRKRAQRPVDGATHR